MCQSLTNKNRIHKYSNLKLKHCSMMYYKTLQKNDSASNTHDKKLKTKMIR